MRGLHPKQLKLIDLLKANKDHPLTFEQLQNELGVHSKSVISHHIKQLEIKGILKRNPFNVRDYQVIYDGHSTDTTYINYYGYGQCGPNGLLLDGNPIDRMAIASQLITFSPLDAFMLKARGDSMTPEINEGDYIIVKKNLHPDFGKIVVCSYQSNVLIKKLVKNDAGQTLLVSFNQKYSPIIPDDSVFITGEVKAKIAHLF